MNLRKPSDFARAVHASSVIISGRPKEGKSDADLLAEVNSLHWIADICQAQDMPLFYHSHNWELVDDLRELRYLMANTDPGENLPGSRYRLGAARRLRPAESHR